ncbi:DUF3306 domain-containing protein [Shewanella sp. C32]|uniref:DUF3306 domain-containing protein n=1 Tax=Shewanella electrica TaxID=515560 RepID=A0ABT2FLZ5_9GAMM|nr:DUF3306 domain-containing protein [Shewanella electrica]MCH1925827.1 DUF3306 domain-containing protein [Shewanella electrica]MCS4557288.1 DUF3306 domain-containing protein [Shewanella electrica]
MSDKPSFLSRWALRKQQVQDGEAVTEATEIEVTDANSDVEAEQSRADVPALATDDDTSALAATNADAEQEPLLGADDLPDPNAIEEGGSFASFMGKNVDPSVRQNALRALWKQPHFSEIDGMMEYALDYSNQEVLTPEVSTELAKKVFRHLIQEEKPADEAASEPMLADTEQSDAVSAADDAQTTAAADVSATAELSDKMDGEMATVSQNAPVAGEKNNDGVA